VNDDSKLKIVVKARQTGYSFAAALRAVLECMRRKTAWIFLSKGERQSRLLMEKVQEHIKAIGIVAPLIEKEFDVGPSGARPEGERRSPLQGVVVKQLEVRFPNGSVIYGLPANPETARGFTGNVTLDEFAFHADADKIYTALYPTITRGYSLEIISTPNGQTGKFYDLAKAAGLVDAVTPAKAGGQGIPASAGMTRGNDKSAWSPHRVTIYEAVEQGLARSLGIPESEFLKALRAGVDDITWAQEYCCEFVSTAAQWISPELWQACVSSEASADLVIPAKAGIQSAVDSRLRGNDGGILFAGWDVARNRDFSVIWISELVGDVSWTRGVITLRNLPTPDQLREARTLLSGDLAEAASPTGVRASSSRDSDFGIGDSRETPHASPLFRPSDRSGGANPQSPTPNPRIHRMCIDKSGMGLAIYEQLAREFPGRVEGVQFTQGVKEAMAVRVRDRMEKRLLRLPDNEEVRHSFMSLKRVVTGTGLTRFDAEHDTHYGHADHFWACALAEAAAEQKAAQKAAANWVECAMLAGRPIVAGLRERVL